MKNINKTEQIILTIAVLILLLSGGLVFFGGLDRIHELTMGREPIGKIENSKNDVRHKSEKALNWIKARSKTPVYEMDSVFTGENSHAQIKLIDGSQFGIDPNSLVIISLAKNQAEIDLHYGNLWSEMSPNSTLVVKSGEKTYELRSENTHQKIRLTQKKSGALKVQVAQGIVKIKEENKPELTVKAEDQPIILNDIPTPPFVAEMSPPPPPRKVAPPQFVTPENQQKLTFEFPEETDPKDAKKSFDVSWSGSTDLKRFEWQLSNDPEFKNILQESQPVQTEHKTETLPSGNYWMRVRGEDSQNIQTDWSEPLTVELSWRIRAPLNLEAPVLTNQNFSYQRQSLNDREPASIPSEKTLRWNPVPNAEKYKVEVSRDTRFTAPEILETTSTQMILVKDDPGAYYYRVTAVRKSKSSPTSKPGKVEVLPSTITLQDIQEIEKVGVKAKPTEALLSWTPVSGASSYTVEIANSPDFVESKKVTFNENNGQVILPKPGEYNVRVQAFDSQSNILSELSDARKFRYKHRPSLVPPLAIEPFNQSSLFVQNQQAAAIWLEWKKVRGASSYEVEVATSEDFSNVVVKQETKDNRYLVSKPLPLGKVYWRVRALSTNNEDASSDWAEKAEFTLYHQKNESFVK